uniref:Stress response protein NST1 n=1 Tax=Enterobius vermicularis TaxID=51028 RepID=A0A0N4V8P6_ENTVE
LIICYFEYFSVCARRNACCVAGEGEGGWIIKTRGSRGSEAQKQFDRTPSSSRRDGRHGHCDCCYCEMFEHSALETARAGRVPQIRERLRQKLQRRNGQEVGTKGKESASSASSCKPPAKVPVSSDAPIEVILNYINEKDNAVPRAATNKAAKRARQKLRKQEEKERLEIERKRKEELRKAKQAEALEKKKEQQAAQEAANREKALKAEEQRRKAAEVLWQQFFRLF